MYEIAITNGITFDMLIRIPVVVETREEADRELARWFEDFNRDRRFPPPVEARYYPNRKGWLMEMSDEWVDAHPEFPCTHVSGYIFNYNPA